MTTTPARPTHTTAPDGQLEQRLRPAAFSDAMQVNKAFARTRRDTRRGVNRITSTENPERHWKPKRSGGEDPAAHLTIEQIEELGREMDAIRQRIIDSRGAADAAYIRRVIAVQRGLDMGGRLVLMVGSRNKAAWVLGTGALTVAKILENMEIGHNVLHGQWDWMRDPSIHSSTWEWDHASPAEAWKHSHNDLHHTYTNVIGRDNDLGFGIARVDKDQPWRPWMVWQPVLNAVNALTFEYSIALYDLELGRYQGKPLKAWKPAIPGLLGVARKVVRQVAKDYVVTPALSGPGWKSTLAATWTANLTRNLWSNGVILCGHFPEGVQTFSRASTVGETRGEWYLRQMLGSANISGSPLMHIMTGNLSHQIEHHCFPDLPSNRYAEVAVEVRDVFDRYGFDYVTGPMPVQLGSAWKKIFKYALPNGAWGELRERPVQSVAAGARWSVGQVLKSLGRKKKHSRR
ncbi:linoleoyl-CoA desaturase [Kytococcus aerolatus]|uniref:Linoleoyl-CoA desaturase n=1 Tax=Kytococcus aerolatus TaxID=592308 RepID=A0A212TC39_9MICO|nr:acyl-CoA desaturase [Kytococcus aerolatus]SNC63593.1 linoleoyl-CoA desaturase [Kytococcus aerolatus]